MLTFLTHVSSFKPTDKSNCHKKTAQWASTTVTSRCRSQKLLYGLWRSDNNSGRRESLHSLFPDNNHKNIRTNWLLTWTWAADVSWSCSGSMICMLSWQLVGRCSTLLELLLAPWNIKDDFIRNHERYFLCIIINLKI